MSFFDVAVSTKETANTELKGFDKASLKHTETTEKQTLPDTTGKAARDAYADQHYR